MGSAQGLSVGGRAQPLSLGQHCWRRLVEWHRTGRLTAIWYTFLDSLDDEALVGWYEDLTSGQQVAQADWMVQMTDEFASYSTARVFGPWRRGGRNE